MLVPLWNEYLNVLPYDNVRIRIVGRPEGSWTDPGHSDADETEIPEKFKYPSTDNVPANYGLVTSDVAAYPEDVSRVFRLSFAYVPDPDTGDINPVRDMRAVVQMADSVVMVPCSFGFNSGFEPESGFDITFGNLSVANVQGGYSASDTAVEVTPPSDMDPSSGWPQIRLGSGYRATGYDDYPCGYWITMLEILTDGRVTARYYPYMLNGSVVLKNSLEGAADDDILRPSEGAMGWSGEYAAYNP